MTTPALRAEGLTKAYNRVEVLGDPGVPPNGKELAIHPHAPRDMATA